MSAPDRPPPELLEARAVVRWLEQAVNALVAVEKTATDRMVSDAAGRARKELRDATKRARSILGDRALRTAEQPSFMED